jgi:hypothetical protein
MEFFAVLNNMSFLKFGVVQAVLKTANINILTILKYKRFAAGTV